MPGTVIEAGATRMDPKSLPFLHSDGKTDHKQGNTLTRSFQMGVSALTKQMNIMGEVGEVREAFRYGITKTSCRRGYLSTARGEGAD